MKKMQTKPFTTLLLSFFLTGYASVGQAQTIKTYQAQEVKPYQAQDLSAGSSKTISNNNDGKPSTNDLSYFFGLYQYWVPGTSYTTPDYTNRQLVITTSSGTGVLPGGISIHKDGTYVWNSSWEGKAIKGKWRTTGDKGYPIELQHAQEGKNWRVGKSSEKGVSIIIWDGATWYNGKKIDK